MAATTTMRWIAYRSSPLPFPLTKIPHPLRRNSSSYGFCSGAPLSSSSLRSNATVSDLLALPVTKSHPKPGDIYVFLQTGGVLFFAYWIANFVVPNWLTKSMGYDTMGENDQDATNTTPPKDNEDNNSVAGDDEEDEIVSSLSKKRGFGSSKKKPRRSS